MSSKVLVVGAGAFGTSAAIELAERGHAVELLDPGPLPHPKATSTDLSKVIRADYGADVFYTELMEHALEGWRALNESWERPLFHETGFAILTSEPMREGGFEKTSYDTLTGRGHPLERLDGDGIAERFPSWRPGRYVDGYFNPTGGWAESGEVVRQLVARARSLGVAVRQERVTDVHQLEADCVVVAAGAWTASLVPELADRLRSVGQPVLHFGPADPASYAPPQFVPWAADISLTGWYGFCDNADGVVKVANHGPGSAVDPDGPRELPANAEEKFRAFLRDAIPGLADAPRVGSRLCLYCDSFDGDLFIDRHPDTPKLVVAAGGSGHGFKFTPVLGPIIADVVEGVDNRFAKRFHWRSWSESQFEDARFSGTS